MADIVGRCVGFAVIASFTFMGFLEMEKKYLETINISANDAAAVKHWDELPEKAILKYANFSEYQRKRQEYVYLLLELNNKKDVASRKEYYDHMKETLRSIRSSPFFVPSTEFDVLWHMVSTTNPKYSYNPELERVPKTLETCEMLRRLFPETKDGICKDANDVVTIRMAYEAFEKKMLVIPP